MARTTEGVHSDNVSVLSGLPTSLEVRRVRKERALTTHAPQDITFPAPPPNGKGTVSDTVEHEDTLVEKDQLLLFFPKFVDHRVVQMSVPNLHQNTVAVIPTAIRTPEYAPSRVKKSALPKFPKHLPIPKSPRTYATATDDDAIVYESESKNIRYVGDRRTALDIVNTWTFLRISSKQGYAEKIEKLRQLGGVRIIFQQSVIVLTGTVEEAAAYKEKVGRKFYRDFTITPIPADWC